MITNYLSTVTATAIYGKLYISYEDKDNAHQNFLLHIGILKGNFPSKLYKFRNINDRTLEVISNKEFYFSSPSDFNDPFDCNLFYKEEYSEEEILEDFNRFIERNPPITLSQMKEKFGMNSNCFFKEHQKMNDELVKHSGILALSRDYKNITMWSHYADNHKGLVFELEVMKDLDFFRLFGLVEYKTEYDLLSYSKDNREELVKLFLIKYIDWKYEKEVRIIDYDKSGPKKFRKEIIKSIIFGHRTTDTNIKKVIQLCEKNGFKDIAFKKAKLVPGKFELAFDYINKERYQLK